MKDIAGAKKELRVWGDKRVEQELFNILREVGVESGQIIPISNRLLKIFEGEGSSFSVEDKKEIISRVVSDEGLTPSVSQTERIAGLVSSSHQSSILKRDIATTNFVKRPLQDVRQVSSPTIEPREEEAATTASSIKEEILLRIRNKPKPILARIIDQLISIPFVGPLRMLRAVGEDNQKEEDRNLLRLYWENGVGPDNLSEAVNKLKREAQVPENDVRVVVLENLKIKLQEYEAGHPLVSFFFKRFHLSRKLDISIIKSAQDLAEAKGAESGLKLSLGGTSNRNISKIDTLFFKKGLRFLLGRGLGLMTTPLLFLAKKVFGFPASLLLYFFSKNKTGYDKSSLIARKGEELFSSGIKKTFDFVSNIFSAKNLGWLRVSLLGLFGGGAILLPLPLPLRLVFLGLGGGLGVAQIKHSGGSSFLTPFLYRGAFWGGRLLLSALAAGGPPAWAIAGVIIAVVVVLAVLTGFISSQQSVFLNETVPVSSASRYVDSIPPSAINVQPKELFSLFEKAAQGQCMPLSMLLAIARVEAGGTFSYSDEDVKLFSTPGWWIGASDESLGRGYCFNTCAQPGVNCFPGADVRGPMQFEIRTWNSILPQVKQVLQNDYGLSGNYEPNRCNLRDAIIGATIKIKANSGTGPNQCVGWTENQVRWNAAYRYCGSCGTVGCISNPDKSDSCSSACGVNYCGSVWSLFNKYSNEK